MSANASDVQDDIDAALQARAAQGSATSASGGDDIDAALRARAKQSTPAVSQGSSTTPTESANPFVRHAQSDLSDVGAASDAFVTGVLNAPHKAWEGAKDIASSIFTGSPITKTEGPAHLEASSKETLTPGVVPTYLAGKTSDAARALETASPTAYNILQHTGRVLGDVGDIAQVAPVVGQVPGLVRKAAASSLFDTAAEPVLATADAAQAAASKAVAGRSGGAAGAAVDTSTLKPDTQQELARGHSAGQTADPDALERIKKAESVGVDLTAGQAKQNTGQMADEFNRRAENKNAVGDRFDAQDDALVQKTKDLHTELAPTAVGNSEIQNGQAAINGVRRYDAPIVKQIDDAYTGAKAANGGNLELDGSNFSDSVASALKPQGKAKFLPSDISQMVSEIGASPDGRLNLDDFEGYRTQLANASREAQAAGKGNAVQAIKVVRDNLESLAPTSDASAQAKGLFDKARGLYKARADEIDANPAYKAVVDDPSYDPRKADTLENPSDIADKYVNKYVLGGPQQATVRLRGMLAGDADANEAITSEAMRPLRKAAEAGKGFGSSEFDGAMKKVNSRPELINNPDALEALNNVNDVGKWTRLQRRGGVFNNSGTGSLLLGAAEKGAQYVPGMAGTAARAGVNILSKSAAKNSIQEMLKPGAGLFDK